MLKLINLISKAFLTFVIFFKFIGARGELGLERLSEWVLKALNCPLAALFIISAFQTLITYSLAQGENSPLIRWLIFVTRRLLRSFIINHISQVLIFLSFQNCLKVEILQDCFFLLLLIKWKRLATSGF